MTNNRKDIADIFKQSEHRLAQRPSANAWRKLDHKLDKHRSRSHLSVVRLMSMAASLLIVVGAIYLFSNSKTKNTSIAQSEAVEMPIPPETLSDLSKEEAGQPILPRLEFQRKIQAKNTPIINEGPRGKKLVVLTSKTEKKVKKTDSDSLRM